MAMVVREVHDPEYVPNGNEIAVIKTARGTVRVKLYGLECPLTVGQFVQLAQDGFYDNLAFHARKEDSVVLGGCPITRNMPPQSGVPGRAWRTARHASWHGRGRIPHQGRVGFQSQKPSRGRVHRDGA